MKTTTLLLLTIALCSCSRAETVQRVAFTKEETEQISAAAKWLRDSPPEITYEPCAICSFVGGISQTMHINFIVPPPPDYGDRIAKDRKASSNAWDCIPTNNIRADTMVLSNLLSAKIYANVGNVSNVVSVVTNLTITTKSWTMNADRRANLEVPEQFRTNIVTALITSGEWCRINGHAWEQGLNKAHNKDNLFINVPTDIIRHCKWCDREEMKVNEWRRTDK